MTMRGCKVQRGNCPACVWHSRQQACAESRRATASEPSLCLHVLLRFVLRDADLYSLQFHNSWARGRPKCVSRRVGDLHHARSWTRLQLPARSARAPWPA